MFYITPVDSILGRYYHNQLYLFCQRQLQSRPHCNVSVLSCYIELMYLFSAIWRVYRNLNQCSIAQPVLPWCDVLVNRRRRPCETQSVCLTTSLQTSPSSGMLRFMVAYGHLLWNSLIGCGHRYTGWCLLGLIFFLIEFPPQRKDPVDDRGYSPVYTCPFFPFSSTRHCIQLSS